jgi:uncharacterized MAPEG superfamily protein
MPIELKMLAWSTCLGIFHIAIAASLATQQRGLKWNAGNRDSTPRALSGAAARADRAMRNFLETFPFFLAAVLAVDVLKLTSAYTALGSELYFWARLLYMFVYIIGIPYFRAVVWAVSILGLLILVMAWL